jgi:predicted SprT family Zn-dependent metalloprotease
MALLGVAPNYSKGELLRAFRRKAKHAHPDAGGGNDMMRALIEAKELLLAWLADRPRTMPAPAAEEEQSDSTVAITPIEYGGLQTAYDHFNRELFSGSLPDVFITYQRRAHSGGYFAPNRFSGRNIKFGRHELALNPDGFTGKSDEWILSVLVHEMAHVWQHHYGDRTGASRGYHDREWAAKMRSIGLQPSSTGMVGGKETGHRMQHYVIDGGPFQQSYTRLAATGWHLNLQSAQRRGPAARPDDSKTKFICPICACNIYGKPSTDQVCRPCTLNLVADHPELHEVLETMFEKTRMRPAKPGAQSYDQAA